MLGGLVMLAVYTFALLPPLWALPALIVFPLICLWWLLRRRGPAERLGFCLLLAGFMIGLLLPSVGSLQPAILRVIVGIIVSGQERLCMDAERLSLECTILPAGGVPQGTTATLSYPTNQSLSYTVVLSSLSQMSYIASPVPPQDQIQVTLAPGETKKLAWPLNSSMLGSQVYVEAYTGPLYDRFRLLVASCGMLWGIRQELVIIGLLLALAGLGAGLYGSRRQ